MSYLVLPHSPSAFLSPPLSSFPSSSSFPPFFLLRSSLHFGLCPRLDSFPQSPPQLHPPTSLRASPLPSRLDEPILPDAHRKRRRRRRRRSWENWAMIVTFLRGESGVKYRCSFKVEKVTTYTDVEDYHATAVLGKLSKVRTSFHSFEISKSLFPLKLSWRSLQTWKEYIPAWPSNMLYAICLGQ